MDELTPEISCMANEVFLGYFECVIQSSTGEECPAWSCADIGVSIPPSNDTETTTDLGGSGELRGITTSSDLYALSPSSAPLVSSNEEDDGDNCHAEVATCKEDSVCVDCSGVVTAETAKEWDSCLSSVFTEDLCTSYGTFSPRRI